MSKGQLAMAAAMLYPEPEKPGRGKKGIVSGQFSKQRLTLARTVLRYCPPAIAPLVLDGTMSLDAAYEEARNHKVASEGAEGVMRRLRTEAQRPLRFR